MRTPHRPTPEGIKRRHRYRQERLISEAVEAAQSVYFGSEDGTEALADLASVQAAIARLEGIIRAAQRGMAPAVDDRAVSPFPATPEETADEVLGFWMQCWEPPARYSYSLRDLRTDLVAAIRRRDEVWRTAVHGLVDAAVPVARPE